MMVGQSYDFVAMNGGECVRKDKQTAIRFACQSIEDIIDVGWPIYVRWDRLHAQKGGRFRDRALIADPARMVWILQDRDARHGRSDASGSLSERPISTPIRRIRLDCCARAASGHAAALPSRA